MAAGVLRSPNSVDSVVYNDGQEVVRVIKFCKLVLLLLRQITPNVLNMCEYFSHEFTASHCSGDLYQILGYLSKMGIWIYGKIMYAAFLHEQRCAADCKSMWELVRPIITSVL